MKVCFLSAAHPALDKRVFDKEARSLREAGFEVVHLCPQHADEPLGRWEKDGVVVQTYASGRGIAARLRQMLNLFRLARDVRADVYHCNEVDSWLIGVLLRIATGRRCVFDVHEHYPSTFAEQHVPPILRPAASAAIRALYLLLAPFTWKIVLAKRTVAGDFWSARRKLVLVQNFARLSALKTDERPNIERKAGPPVLIHLGVIGTVRGWPQMLEMLAMMRRKDAILHVIGDFVDHTEEAFFAQADALGVRGRVRFDRWMPFDEAFQRLLAADIGLILFLPGIQNHVYALPHKMFDYMLAELPVIAPDFAVEVRDIVTESDCGALVDPTNPSAIAEAVDAVLDDPVRQKALGENGRRAVIARYNWEQEAVKLVAMYRELDAHRPAAAQAGGAPGYGTP